MVSGFQWGNVAEGIAVLGVGGVMGYLGWLWKRSIYGKFDIYDQKLADLKDDQKTAIQLMSETFKAEISKITFSASNMYQKKQDQKLCEAFRMGCSKEILEKFHGVERSIEETKEHFDSQLKIIIDRQTQVIERIDNILLTHPRKI